MVQTQKETNIKFIVGLGGNVHHGAKNDMK
jgi:hypothetical protein